MAQLRPREGIWINGLLVVAAGLLLVGIFAPLLTLEKFFVFSNQVSLWTGLLQLLDDGNLGLFFLLLAFSILVPIGKIGFLLRVWNFEPARSLRHRRKMEWIAHYGKWSMLDVFVVAVLVVSIKLGALASVEINFGFYAFAASVLLTMLISERMLYLHRLVSGGSR
jgi:paraquat-inducible protein A